MKFQILVLLFATLMSVACQGPAKKSTAEFEGERKPASRAQITPQNSSSYYQQISFDRNSAALSAADKDKLDLLVQKARRAGRIDDIKIVAWADGEYADKREDKLPAKERHLADARANSILIYLKDQTRGIRSQHYNMASRPNVLQELLATPDARMKNSLENAGLATTNHDLRYPENASKALILVMMKQ